MFSFEQNGYSIQEVDKYIAKLKAEYEAKLMEEKLKVLESENKLLDFRKKSLELENREKNIMSALDAFRRYQDEGSKNITALRREQLNMIYQEFLLVIKELSLQYRGIESNSSLMKVKEALNTIVNNIEIESEDLTSKANTENDSMRMLLNKMQGYKKSQDNPREVKISRADERKNQIRPVTDLQLEEGDDYSTLADKFLATAPQENKKTENQQSSGFDLREAINPKDDLAEIMKAFDFYNGDDNE